MLALENVYLKEKFCVTGEFYLKLLCKTWVNTKRIFVIHFGVLRRFYLKANEHTTITNGNEAALELSTDVEVIQ